MFALAFGYRHVASACCVGEEPVMRELPAYLDLFAGGMLAAYCVVWMRVRRVRIAPLVFTIAAALCAWGAFALMQSADTVQYVILGPQRWDVVNRTYVALAAGGLIACSCLAGRAWRAAIANPLTIWLSIVSYNVYLWHTLLMVWMWKHDVPHAVTKNPHDDPHWKLVYIALGWSATFAVATGVTYFVERPLLGVLAPQRFAFDWTRFRAGRGAPRVTPPAPDAAPETRTSPSRRNRTPSPP